jgi:hypothetical protein
MPASDNNHSGSNRHQENGMNQPKHFMDESDIGSGEQENSDREAVGEEVRKIDPDKVSPERKTINTNQSPERPDADGPSKDQSQGQPQR